MEIQMIEEMRQFNYLMNEIDAAYHEAALKFGLSDSALLILYTICSNGNDCLLSDITQLSGVSKQTINSAVHKLEQEEIVYLEVFRGRKKKIYLTEKGRALVKQSVLHIVEIENQILGSWTKEERKLYVDLTQRYLSSFREKMEELTV